MKINENIQYFGEQNKNNLQFSNIKHALLKMP